MASAKRHVEVSDLKLQLIRHCQEYKNIVHAPFDPSEVYTREMLSNGKHPRLASAGPVRLVCSLCGAMNEVTSCIYDCQECDLSVRVDVNAVRQLAKTGKVVNTAEWLAAN